MEFVIENIDINNYSGEILFYWLERDITFKYDINRIKQKKNTGTIKLDYKLEGTYKLGHNLRNKQTNKKENHIINIYSNNILEIEGGGRYAMDWIYFNIKSINKNDVIFDIYDKSKFRFQEKEQKKKTILLNKEYWNKYWSCLHLLSIFYPEEPSNEIKSSIKKLLKKLESNGLKCRNCTEHFRRYLKDFNRDEIVRNRDNLFIFFVELHNKINKMNSKRQLSIEEINEIYKDTDKIEIDLIDNYKLNIKRLLLENKIEMFPDIYNTEGRKMMKRRLGLFVLEK